MFLIACRVFHKTQSQPLRPVAKKRNIKNIIPLPPRKVKYRHFLFKFLVFCSRLVSGQQHTFEGTIFSFRHRSPYEQRPRFEFANVFITIVLFLNCHSVSILCGYTSITFNVLWMFLDHYNLKIQLCHPGEKEQKANSLVPLLSQCTSVELSSSAKKSQTTCSVNIK